MIDDDGNVNGVSLHYFGGTDKICDVDDPTRLYELTVNVQCDKGNYELKGGSYNLDGCFLNFTYTHDAGCARFKMSKFFAFMERNNNLWGAVSIVIGIFFTFFGSKFVNAVIYIMGTLACFFIVSVLFFDIFMKNVKKQWILWVVISLLFIGANIVGFILVKFRKLGIATLAVWGGFMIGFMITTTFFINNLGVVWIIVIGCSLASWYTALKIEERTIMFLTCFSGSYFLIRGISMYAGGFPNEILLKKEIDQRAVEWETFDKAFYGYLCAIIALTVMTTYYQVKHSTHSFNNKSIQGGL